MNKYTVAFTGGHLVITAQYWETDEGILSFYNEVAKNKEITKETVAIFKEWDYVLFEKPK